MLLEFGRPTTLSSALGRIPDRNDPNYNSVDGGPYEHCAHLREFVFSTLAESATRMRVLKNIPLEERAIPLETDDMRLLFQVNSFYREPGEKAFTRNWARIPGDSESPWQFFEPPEDGENQGKYNWWQISRLDPEVKLGWYNLYCIETNCIFEQRKSTVRFNENSQFNLVFATKGEINNLKKLLGPDY